MPMKRIQLRGVFVKGRQPVPTKYGLPVIDRLSQPAFARYRETPERIAPSGTVKLGGTASVDKRPSSQTRGRFLRFFHTNHSEERV